MPPQNPFHVVYATVPCSPNEALEGILEVLVVKICDVDVLWRYDEVVVFAARTEVAGGLRVTEVGDELDEEVGEVH